MVIMNPPFTIREKMGEKFSDVIRRRLRTRVDGFERALVEGDSELDGFVSKRSIGPMFEALAEKCVDADNGVLAMVRPTVVFTGPAARRVRQILPSGSTSTRCSPFTYRGDINLSQNTAINESLIVVRRHEGGEAAKPPTRVISLDRMPGDDRAVAELHDSLTRCEKGVLSDGWGEVSEWPVDRISAGDWTAGVFRSPELDHGAYSLASDKSLFPMEDQFLTPSAVLDGGGRGRCDKLTRTHRIAFRYCSPKEPRRS